MVLVLLMNKVCPEFLDCVEKEMTVRLAKVLNDRTRDVMNSSRRQTEGEKEKKNHDEINPQDSNTKISCAFRVLKNTIHRNPTKKSEKETSEKKL